MGTDGPASEVVEDGFVAAAAALVAWAAVAVVAEAAGLEPWRWPGGAVGGLAVAAVVVVGPAFVVRRRYGVSVPEEWVRAGMAGLAGAVVAALAMLGWVVASLFWTVQLPWWTLSQRTMLAVIVVGGLLGVGISVAVERVRAG